MLSLNRNFSIPPLKPEILCDVGDAVVKSPGLSAEEWLGASDASSNRELSMRCMDLKASLVAGAPFHCFDSLCDFISGTEEFKSTLNIFRTKSKDEAVPQAKRRWVLSSKSGLIGLHSFGHRNNGNFVRGGSCRKRMKWDQILCVFANLLFLFVFCLFFAACGMTTLPTRPFEK